jgi:pimeloyl-ACP methyl ester carboxylesterase
MQAHAAAALPAPAKWRMATEWRALGELGTSLTAWPLLVAAAQRGDGHPVLVLPGFLAGDASTYVTRAFLAQTGFDPYGWELGRNMGGIRKMRAGLAARLEAIYARTNRRVSIVGWSLGGVYARDLAHSHPEIVRYVVGLASPLTRDLRSANTGKLYARAAKEDADPGSGDAPGTLAREFDRLAGDLPCPATAMYSRCDGIVNWRTCLIAQGPRSENLEVALASHTGFGINAAALLAIADRLAQADGAFAPFVPRGPLARLYASGTAERSASL